VVRGEPGEQQNGRQHPGHAAPMATGKFPGPVGPSPPLRGHGPVGPIAVQVVDQFVDGKTSEFSRSSTKLPVELAAFEATPTGASSVELTWTTASETGNAGFRVQRRGPQADTWTTVGFVEGAGTTTQSRSYRFEVGDLAVGTHAFRLKQVDIDGSTRLHDAISVEVKMQQALRLSPPAPNPVQGRATLSFAVRERAETTITLYNVLGQQVRTVYRGTPPAGTARTARFSTSGLASGVYVLRLSAGGRAQTRRVSVVR
jgi:hypothetical protein